jgi:hypothetical protein
MKANRTVQRKKLCPESSGRKFRSNGEYRLARAKDGTGFNFSFFIVRAVASARLFSKELIS